VITAKDIFRSAIGVVFVKLFSQVSSFLATLIIVRFISKEDFGLASMAFIVMGLIDSLIDFGFLASIIQRKEIKEGELSTCFWALVFFSLIVIVITFFSAPIIKWVFNDDRVVELIHILILTFFIIPIQILSKGILTRAYKINFISKAEFIGALFRVIGSIYLAIKGYGVWCLIYGFMLDKFIVAIVLSIQTKWYPAWHFSLDQLKPFLSFGVNITFSRIIYLFVSKIDSIIIGRVLGAEMLGLYAVAIQFVNVLTQLIITTANKVLFPVFSKYQSSDKLLNIVYRSCALISFVALPSLVGLSILAEDLIYLAFGESWQESGYYLQMLAISGCFQVMSYTLPQVFNSINNTRVNVRLNIISLVFYSLGLSISSVLWGIDGVLLTLIGLTILRFLLVLSLAVKIIKLDVKKYLKADIEVVVVVALMALFLNYLMVYMQGIESIYRIIILTISGVMIYISCGFILFKTKTIKLMSSILNR